MSFNRLNYDTKAYQKALDESVSASVYQINEPKINNCYSYLPTTRLQKNGVSVDKNIPLIDIGSELLGLSRRASKDPLDRYIPCCPNTKCVGGYPCGQGVVDDCDKNGTRPNDNLNHPKDCFFPQENCRLNNPPCTLRGTGWNRWEWLCFDPQNRIEIPFDYNINNRIIVKDNHRPCVPTPIDPKNALPNGGQLSCEKLSNTCGVPTDGRKVYSHKCG